MNQDFQRVFVFSNVSTLKVQNCQNHFGFFFFLHGVVFAYSGIEKFNPPSMVITVTEDMINFNVMDFGYLECSKILKVFRKAIH